MFRSLLLLPLLLMVACPFFARASGTARDAREDREGTLTLTTGDRLPGKLLGVSPKGEIRWACPWFREELVFPVTAIEHCRFPALSSIPTPKSMFRFDLVGGDIVFGELVEWTEKFVTLRSERAGQVTWSRSAILGMRRIASRDDEAKPIAGVGLLSTWTVMGGRKLDWEEEAGRLSTKAEQASIWKDVGLKSGSRFVDLSLEWAEKASFRIGIGVPNDLKEMRGGVFLETWQDELVLHRDGGDFGFEPVKTLAKEQRSLRIRLYVDPENASITATNVDGAILAIFKRPPIGDGIFVENSKADLVLADMQVRSWRGNVPEELGEAQARLLLADGTIVQSEVRAADVSQGTLELVDGRTFDLDAIDSVRFGASSEAQPALAQLSFSDGWGLSGTLIEMSAGVATIKSPFSEEPLSVKMNGLLVLKSNEKEEPDAVSSAHTLEGRQGRLQGTFAGFESIDGETVARFSPAGSSVFVTVTPAFKGQVTIGPVRSASRLTKWPELLFLRNGDVLPCKLVSLGATDAVVEVGFGKQQTIPQSAIQAIDFAPKSVRTSRRSSKSRDIAEFVTGERRDHLLTIPRSRSKAPPTHILFARNGDSLRGRLIALTADKAEFETRLRPREFSRLLLQGIVMLHEDSLKEEQWPATVVCAFLRGQRRIAFVPTGFEDGHVLGASPVLGDVRIPLVEVENLHFGVTPRRKRTPYSSWKPLPAEEPFPEDDGDTPREVPKRPTSPLVGNLAPDFHLDLAGGGKVRLSDLEGKVVVLDFWATWCGPCIRGLPIVRDTVRAYDSNEVALFAVNLREDEKKVKAFLEKHDLKLNVPLDADGSVATKYLVEGIPQTVVIGKDGKVAAVHVGFAPDLAEKLGGEIRAALEKVHRKRQDR